MLDGGVEKKEGGERYKKSGQRLNLK